MNLNKKSDINRHSEKRSDETWIAEQIKNDKSYFIPVNNSLFLFKEDGNFSPVYFSIYELNTFNISAEEFIFLGTSNGNSYFVIDVSDEGKKIADEKGKFIELRKALLHLKELDRNILLHARAMFYWQSRHKYCGTCGSPTESKEAGNLLVCTNENCGISHFPRTDPAIIVLVTKNDKCLLGHSKGWPGNRYSTLAGFVEPGESLEETVKREVFEESGIIVKNIKYFSSQPWPFPSSLMVGFTAEAENENIVINDNELESVLWFSRDEIKEKLTSGEIKMPGKVSIAFKLISRWFDDKGFGKLSEIAGNE